MLRSKTYAANVTINGVLLGSPVIVNHAGQSAGPGDDLSLCWWAWDDPRIGSGVLNDDGTITPDAIDI